MASGLAAQTRTLQANCIAPEPVGRTVTACNMTALSHLSAPHVCLFIETITHWRRTGEVPVNTPQHYAVSSLLKRTPLFITLNHTAVFIALQCPCPVADGGQRVRSQRVMEPSLVAV